MLEHSRTDAPAPNLIGDRFGEQTEMFWWDSSAIDLSSFHTFSSTTELILIEAILTNQDTPGQSLGRSRDSFWPFPGRLLGSLSFGCR